MHPWIKKYSPKKESGLKGQDQAIKQLKDFIQNYKKQKKKAALIYGPPGSGKTSSVYALAHNLDLEVLEVNASDFRNKENINALIGTATKQQSLFSKGKIILVDEIDGLSGSKDRGGIQAIVQCIKTTNFPMILTATNPWDTKFSTLRNNSALIEYHALNYLTIANILKKICEKENIKYDESALKQLARSSGGDARAAINDLQSLTQEKKELTKKSLDDLASRDQTETILNALTILFKTTDPKVAIKAFDNIQEDQNQCFLWIDKNLPKEYEKPEDLARAYDVLSRADVFRGRIKRWQHWRFMVYINALLTAGIATAKKEKYSKFTKYTPTGRLLKLWWAKQKLMKKKAIAQKIAQATHTSTRVALQTMLPYMQIIFKKNKKAAKKLTEQLDLDKEEVAWLKK